MARARGEGCRNKRLATCSSFAGGLVGFGRISLLSSAEQGVQYCNHSHSDISKDGPQVSKISWLRWCSAYARWSCNNRGPNCLRNLHSDPVQLCSQAHKVLLLKCSYHAAHLSLSGEKQIVDFPAGTSAICLAISCYLCEWKGLGEFFLFNQNRRDLIERPALLRFQARAGPVFDENALGMVITADANIIKGGSERTAFRK